MTIDNGVLQDFPPQIPGSISDVKSENPGAGQPLVGIPLRLTESGRLRVVVDPPVDQPGNPVTDVTLFIDGVKVDVAAIIDDQLRRSYLVPRTLLREGLQRFTYKVQRLSGNVSESAVLFGEYSLHRPGGKDVDPRDNYHDGLSIELQKEIIDNGVGPIEAKAGVWVTVFYFFMKLHDVITLKWNGVDVTRVVGVSDDPNEPDVVGSPIKIFVTKEVIEEAGNNPKSLILYTVKDQLENYTERSLWSIAHEIDVDTTEKQFAAPDLIEDPNDEDDDAETIDPVKVNKTGYLHARVHAFKGLFESGDFIRGNYICTPISGQPVTDTSEVPVNRIPSTYVLKISANKVVPGGQVKMTCDLIRKGMVIASSYRAVARVLKSGEGVLPAPTVQVVEGGVLRPGKNLEGANARVELIGFLPGDLAKLVVKGASGAGSPTFGFKSFNTNSRANFKLDTRFIRANIGLKVEFSWILLRDGKETLSESLLIAVESYSEQDPNFPAPEVLEANGRDLDTRSFIGDARLAVPRWPFIDEGQPYTLDASGTDANGNSVTILIASGKELTQAEVEKGLKKPLLRQDLLTLRNSSELTVRAKVDLHPNENEQTIVTFPLQSYRVTTLPLLVPAITSVRDSKGEIKERGYTTDTRVTVIVTSSPGLEVQILNGNSAVSTKFADDKGISTHTLVGLGLTGHRLVAKTLFGPQPESAAFNFTVLSELKAPTISYVLWNGNYAPSGGNVTAGTWVTFFGTCDARPYLRALFLTTHVGGGYVFHIPANHTTWTQLANWHSRSYYHHHVLDYESNLSSNVHSINWV
ncbi:hypothetical protein [Pseudomonas sp. DR48]|uniref:hypothetical protein n=1 Tax=Pseudomonas sp. DR48 TaxID=2871095 RepID=UPI001C98E9DB|nr:hypothetical protein [Pseudomonas sp. DR48]QZP35484.1 hypothetical protein K5K95_14210 [Pseudomonas sp. DR48]